jgi:hypothetical protein
MHHSGRGKAPPPTLTQCGCKWVGGAGRKQGVQAISASVGWQIWQLRMLPTCRASWFWRSSLGAIGKGSSDMACLDPPAEVAGLEASPPSEAPRSLPGMVAHGSEPGGALDTGTISSAGRLWAGAATPHGVWGEVVLGLWPWVPRWWSLTCPIQPGAKMPQSGLDWPHCSRISWTHPVAQKPMMHKACTRPCTWMFSPRARP